MNHRSQLLVRVRRVSEGDISKGAGKVVIDNVEDDGVRRIRTAFDWEIADISAWEWCDYPEKIGGDRCIRVQPRLIEGFISNILIFLKSGERNITKSRLISEKRKSF